MTPSRLLLLALLVGMPVFATTINFDGLTAGYLNVQGLLPVGATLTNQLAAQGVVFSDTNVTNNVSSVVFVPGVATAGNFLGVVHNVLFSPTPGFMRILFTNGATGISFNLFDPNVLPAERVVINAYNSSDVVIQTAQLGNNDTALINIAAAAYIDIFDSGADGYVIDNLSFTTNANGAIPEPATYTLIGLGLAALGLIRARRR